MKCNYFRQIHHNLLSLFICIILANISLAQIGLQAPVYTANFVSDSSAVSYPKPILPLRNWFDQTDQFFDLKQEANKLDIYQYISLSNIIPKDAFRLDMRGSSYYVPRMVRDELNLMMNRPRDNSFIPILPAAFLALQLANQYLLVQMKTEITWQDVENCKEGLPVLEELWKEAPQTLSGLYKKDKLRDNYTMIELQRLTDILIDNKLIKRKLIEKSETQYFYALDKKQYFELIERGKNESIMSRQNQKVQ